VLNCAVSSTALRLSSASSSSSLFLSAAAASRTSLSSRSRSIIRCSLSSACCSWSARPLALSASYCYKITRSSATLQKKNNQEVIIHHRQLTMSVWLMVTMLVCKARMSSLSSNQSSCQGVWSQLIDRRGSIGLEVEDGGMLTDKRRIPLRSASVRTQTFFTTRFPRFLSIRGERGLQSFDLPLHTSYSNPNYD
jgi:hypothetical protein